MGTLKIASTQLLRFDTKLRSYEGSPLVRNHDSRGIKGYLKDRLLESTSPLRTKAL